MPKANMVLNVGDTTPTFILESATGRLVKFAEVIGKQNIMLVFLRGMWCQHCQRHLALLRRDYVEYARMGMRIWGVVGQKPSKLRKYIRKNYMPFPLLADSERAVMRIYGVYQPISLETLNNALPATFIIDRDGIIRFIYVGYSQIDRPSKRSIINCSRQLYPKEMYARR